ncbi:MAG TPA: DUF2279 domain-containing protein [Clostridiales bacterium]|nr:DUF2279 domain-containing protein [Clostridiales bacterium]
MFKIFTSAVLLFISVTCINAETFSDSTGVNYGRLSFSVGATSLSAAGSFYVMKNAWWQDESESFHFDDGTDLKYAKNLDKFGHFFGGYVSQDLLYRSLIWSNVSKNYATAYSVGMSVFVQVMIDLKDAYAPKWGFSPWDVAAGAAGAVYKAAQNHYPVLDDYKFKITYYSRENKYYAQHDWALENAIENYPSQTYWLTAPLDNFLPESVSARVPDWLGLAAGLSISDKVSEQLTGDYMVYLSLDIDLEKLVRPYNKPWLSTTAHYLNFIKVPAPALRFHPGFKGYAVYF